MSAIRDASGSRLMAAFAGTELPPNVAAAIGRGSYAGVTLFRHHNVESVGQVRDLTAAVQAAAPAHARPLLIATDQETGQLSAIGEGTTQFAGAMALGAAGDEELVERVAGAIGRELHALGVNVDYVPACDLATTPGNPAMGVRSFGDDPQAVARLVAATVRGLQAEGVAATAKHFPGIGDAAVDTHHELAVVAGDLDAFVARELVPFRAAIDAGARLVMCGHVSVPGLTHDERLPSSLARAVVTDLLRDKLGFDGLAITDALDMRALGQGAAQIVDVIVALRAGQDLLLATPDAELVARVEDAVAQARLRGLIATSGDEATARRFAALRAWLNDFDQPPLDVVGCAEHAALARELAERSVTLVRNDDDLLPLRPPADARILVIQPAPADLTPADTSSTVEPALADAIRRRWPATDGVVAATTPAEAETAALRERATGYDVVVLGTDAAHLRPEQAELARAVLDAGRPTVTVALRTPWDLCAYPASRTHAVAYSILAPSTEALAGALFGEQPFGGRLPVEVGSLYRRGHGLTAWH